MFYDLYSELDSFIYCIAFSSILYFLLIFLLFSISNCISCNSSFKVSGRVLRFCGQFGWKPFVNRYIITYNDDMDVFGLYLNNQE